MTPHDSPGRRGKTHPPATTRASSSTSGSTLGERRRGDTACSVGSPAKGWPIRIEVGEGEASSVPAMLGERLSATLQVEAPAPPGARWGRGARGRRTGEKNSGDAPLLHRDGEASWRILMCRLSPRGLSRGVSERHPGGNLGGALLYVLAATVTGVTRPAREARRDHTHIQRIPGAVIYARDRPRLV